MIRSPYATRMTTHGVLNMDNRKPYRTKAQKMIARERAEISSGTHRCVGGSSAPYNLHKPSQYNPSRREVLHHVDYLEMTASV